MIDVRSIVDMPDGVVAAMNVHVARQTVVVVNRAAQCHCGVNHRAGRGQRLRGGNNRALLYERDHCQQHEAASDPSEARVQAESHQDLIRHLRGCEQAILQHPVLIIGPSLARGPD